MPAKGPFQLGLTGWPLGHSLSPRIHQAALRLLNLQGAYTLYPIPPGPELKTNLAALLAKLRSSELQGLNVTIPYKVEILRQLDQLSPAAEAIGAANTLYYRHQKLCGDNTDAAGFQADLRDRFPQLFTGREGKLALVLGSGGAARAVVFALLQIGFQVVVASRSTRRGEMLAARFQPVGPPGSVSVIQLAAAPLLRLIQEHAVHLIANATPLGMAPEIAGSPWPVEVPYPPRAVVYDLVYAPAETRFVKAARQAGLPACTGLGMLVEQAACAFEIWTGLKPCQSTLLEELQKEAASP